MKQKPILAFDSVCVGASIALMVDGTTYARALTQSRQAAELVSAIDGLLREHGVAYGDLGCIVSTIGPGSFTGVRIGLAALHGFVLVSAMPIKLLSTLEAMAWQVARSAKAPADYYIALRAGKGEVYVQRFMQDHRIPVVHSDIFLAPETKTDWDLPYFGNALAATAANYIAGPDAAILCAIAEHLPTATLANALPLYIRPPDAKQPTPLTWLAQN